MAPRHGRSDAQLKKKYERKTDRIVLVAAIIGLVLCCAINGAVLIVAILVHAPEQAKLPVPEQVFWIFGAALVPDFVKLLRGDKS